ncbi:hypothetical protein GQX74_002070 [Glossina fuscipes]|nr:hypothetical protein GQX74_002070 [Glossina fuscipes]
MIGIKNPCTAKRRSCIGEQIMEIVKFFFRPITKQPLTEQLRKQLVMYSATASQQDRYRLLLRITGALAKTSSLCSSIDVGQDYGHDKIFSQLKNTVSVNTVSSVFKTFITTGFNDEIHFHNGNNAVNGMGGAFAFAFQMPLILALAYHFCM